MAVLAIAFALASCTEVDLWDEVAIPHRADVSLTVSDGFASDSTLFVAHRLFVPADTAVTVSGTSATLKDIVTGDYKFYALSLDRSTYSYGKSVDSLLTLVADTTGHKVPMVKSIFKDNIIVSFKPYSWNKNSWASVKNSLELSGDFINPEANAVYCDSTLLVTLEPSVASNVKLSEHSCLTTNFTVSFAISAHRDITNYNVYCVIPNVGYAVDLQKNVDYSQNYQALVKMSPKKDGETYTYTGEFNAFGVTPGTMKIYVCSGTSKVNEAEASFTVNLRDSKIKASGTVLTIN